MGMPEMSIVVGSYWCRRRAGGAAGLPGEEHGQPAGPGPVHGARVQDHDGGPRPGQQAQPPGAAPGPAHPGHVRPPGRHVLGGCSWGSPVDLPGEGRCCMLASDDPRSKRVPGLLPGGGKGGGVGSAWGLCAWWVRAAVWTRLVEGWLQRVGRAACMPVGGQVPGGSSASHACWASARVLAGEGVHIAPGRGLCLALRGRVPLFVACTALRGTWMRAWLQRAGARP